MELPQNVKPRPWILNLFPGLSQIEGLSIYPNIYLRKDIYSDLAKNFNPNPANIAVLIHEQEHIKRYKKFFLLKYIFSRSFRLREELAATVAQMRYLKSLGLNFDIDLKARHLSSWYYEWDTPYETAKEKLSSLWREI